MAGAIRIKRPSAKEDAYKVYKNSHVVAHIRRSAPGESGHREDVPWLLVAISGRIDRYESFQDAVDEAHKI